MSLGIREIDDALRIATPPAIRTPEVMALDPRAVRARRRPLAVAAVWLWELLFGLLIAAPIHAWASRTWGAHPDGDAVFYRGGGHELMTWLADGELVLPVIVRITILVLFIGMLSGQVLLGTLVASLTTTRGPTGAAPRALTSFRAGLSAFFPLAALGILFWALQMLVLIIGYFLASAIGHAVLNSVGEARSFTIRFGIFGFFAFLALVLGVIADLGPVGIAREVALASQPTKASIRLREGLADAFRTARHAGGRAVVAWGWRATIAFALVPFGGLLGVRAAGAGGAVLFLVFVMHQLIIFARTALRASWLANAVRLVEAARR